MTKENIGKGDCLLVLDTSAFVAGFDPLSIAGDKYIVPLVEQEIIGNSMASVRIKAALENGRLRIIDPRGSFVDRVKRSASEVGDKFLMSDTDIQVLAGALELKQKGRNVMILTDDYSMQNVADAVGLGFCSLATFGIKYRLEWMRYCPACHKRYASDYAAKTCDVCGTQLKRKSIKKNDLATPKKIENGVGNYQ